MAQYTLTTPLTSEDTRQLKAGDTVLLNGTIFTARDAAHKRLVELLEKGEELPFDIEGSVIYFVGPTPPKPGDPIGSAGPTTSYRMDSYSPTMLRYGSKGMIGKGKRNQVVKDACKEYDGIYFGATGGAGALLGKKITSAEVIAYPELGPEAVRKITVKDFPVTVINDTYGNDLYQMGREQYEVKD
ncbi:Fe-S-containing hydro-lyase [Sulfurovum sp. NBC37-1]|uniref:Fe-S-containing hydro-lyase n=1 Tax=Sulfurovum sp. (strain NBC37-1) TaxID=387093 RepID=UPI0001587627|nr:Fe-S-containing hydro-lyase [Sulfurovum sp. NBC37-1]BAF71534.1 fumarate/tartrate hydratase, beta subunit [Sulfurovum sp. NBC37-1]